MQSFSQGIIEKQNKVKDLKAQPKGELPEV